MSFSRRAFLKSSAAGCAAAVVFPAIIRASALGLNGATAPSDRIVMGWIGCGGQGRSLLTRFIKEADVQVLALCDADNGNLNTAAGVVSKAYKNNIAMHLGRKLKWDPRKKQFIGDNEANALVRPKMRAPGRL